MNRQRHEFDPVRLWAPAHLPTAPEGLALFQKQLRKVLKGTGNHQTRVGKIEALSYSTWKIERFSHDHFTGRMRQIKCNVVPKHTLIVRCVLLQVPITPEKRKSSAWAVHSTLIRGIRAPPGLAARPGRLRQESESDSSGGDALSDGLNKLRLVPQAASDHLGSDLLRGPVGTGGDAGKLGFEFRGESNFQNASVMCADLYGCRHSRMLADFRGSFLKTVSEFIR